jgi:hypothetical protein
VRGVGGSPPYPPYHKNLGCQGEIAKPGCQGKSFDANFLKKDLASLGSSAYAVRMNNKIMQGDYIQVDEHYYVVCQVHSESVFCRNADSGQNCYVDFCDIEKHIKSEKVIDRREKN